MVTLPLSFIANAENEGTSDDNAKGGNYVGPFEYGGAIYFVLHNEGAGGAPFYIGVWKSTDSGVTWTEQDTANHTGNIGNSNRSYDVALDGTVLRVVYKLLADSSIRIKPFDMAADTWGAESSAGPTSSFIFVDAATPIRMLKAGADFYVFFNRRVDIGAQISDCNYIPYSAGVWGAEQTLVPGTSYPYPNTGVFLSARALSVCVASSGVMQIVGYTTFTTATPVSIWIATLTTGGVVTGPDEILAQNTAQRFFQGIGQLVEWTNPVTLVKSLVFPMFDRNSSPFYTGVWVGTPVAAPVWTWEPLSQLGPTDADFPYTLDASLFIDSDGALWLMWTARDFSDANPANWVSAKYLMSNDGNGWGTVDLYYDEITNPPTTGPAAGQPLEDIPLQKSAFGILSNGLAAAMIGFNCLASYYLLDESCDITVDVGGLIVPMDSPETVQLPPAASGSPYRPILILPSEGGGVDQNFEFEVTVEQLPPHMFMLPPTGPPVSVGPVESTEGVRLVGTPTLAPFVGPTVYTWGINVRLFQ